MARRIGLVVLGLVAAWLVALVAIDVIVGREQPERIRVRVGDSLQGSASVGDVDLALVRGRLSIDRLSVRRDDDVGHLALDVPEVRCELLPLGAALADRDCEQLAVRGVRLEISSLAVFHPPHPKHAPIRADDVEILDSTLTFAPSTFLPALGKIAIEIKRATAGPTVLRTPLSWIFALETLDATIELPAGIALHLTFGAGMFGAAGSLFGDTPVVVPVELPHPTGDARDEMRGLVQLGEDIAERLVAKRATDWLGEHH